MLSLPIYDLKMKEEDGKKFLWDPIRKRYLAFTPEEFVRQTLVKFLAEACGFPLSLFSIEKGLKYNQLAKRYDLVIYDREARPLVAAECKRPTVPIDQAAVRQLVTYNQKVGASHLLLTNGKVLHFLSRLEGGDWHQLEAVPGFEELSASR